MTALDPSGRYCMASGHAQNSCPGSGPFHRLLYWMGLGIGIAPGPTDAELRDEIDADWQMLAYDMHGRDVAGQRVW